MAVASAILLGRFITDTVGESVVSLVSECCSAKLDLNGSCPVNHLCNPGCYRLRTEDGSSTCITCTNENSMGTNVTECRNFGTQPLDLNFNASTTPSLPHNLGSPGIAASLLLGTLFISLFLVLSVASFFYLKRSHKLPEIFYRRNKGDPPPKCITTIDS
ncbi:hypothetical protein GDO86_012711 [Hymenochirus boettgeri]|uniref:Uncharacterized protein n=1 Tax=Hymenochirus boettgeri TaxID=247094 RepID=A0A8T2IR33_9PIPI|nr:hypothetical protein GDO86_012711 [Hymenochirus boettgeri]